MNDILMMMTAPTLRTAYIEGTLKAIDDEGGRHLAKVACFDGSGPPYANDLFLRYGWVVHVYDGPSGTRTAMWNVFKSFLEISAKFDSGGFDRLIFVEDDLRLAPNAINRICRIEVPDDAAFVTFYDHKEFPDANPATTPAGLHIVEAPGGRNSGLWGSLCLLIPRRTVEFVTTRGPFDWMDPWQHTRNAGDCVLSWACKFSPWPRFAVHQPSLVDHAGEESSIEIRRVRRATWFEGGK